MNTTIGNLPNFEVGSDWKVFKERLSIWLNANTITKTEGSGDRRRAVLLSALTEAAYKLVRELISPKTVEELSYEDLIQHIDKHLLPKKSLFAERYNFHSAQQRVDEDFTQWAARVRWLSADCKFAGCLDDMLRDRFVLGMQGGPERDRLFTEDAEQLTLARALDTAVALSSARSAARHCSAPRAPPPLEVYKVAAQQCEVCGYSNHGVDKCRFKAYKCKKCGERGHLKRMCQKPKYVNAVHQARESDGDDGETKKSLQQNSDCIFNIRSYRGEAMNLSVDVCGKKIKFEVDSGSCATAIPIEMYNLHFKHLPLNSPKIVLKSYSGEIVNTVGTVRVPITYEGEQKCIDMYVVKDAGPALLGRDFLSIFKLQISKVNFCGKQSEIEYYTSKYPALFSDRLGCLKLFTVKLLLKPDSQPIFFRARTVPFAIRLKVEQELDRLVRTGVLEPVDHSDFASPVVPILKRSGEIRLCADYSVTLNKVLQIEKYPLPRTEELFAKLHGGKQFSQLDLSQAYLQLRLDDDSQLLTTINTHKGLFKFTRLVFGLSNAPAIFQKTMERLLRDIDGVLCLLDDVLVTGDTREQHCQRLELVFSRLQDAGLVLNKDKCNLFKDSVTYLGFVIDRHGIHKCSNKVKAMITAKCPTNVHELKSFLGLVNYYRIFVPNASSILSPLNSLLQKETKWEWTPTHEQAFLKIKEELAAENTLAHYDPQLKLVLTVDASPWGLGAILGQLEGDTERPLAYASRALSNAERNYSQIEKEATAIVFGIRRFHQYLYGLDVPFILRTDHKPLMYIFHPHKGVPEVSANRLQRYALFLNSYNYEIQYVSSVNNSADYLSRAPGAPPPRPGTPAPGLWDRATYVNFVTDGDLPLNLQLVRDATSTDMLLDRVKSYVINGWPKKIPDEQIHSYFSCKSDLTFEQGCLMRGHKLVIPATLQTKILNELHRCHLGINKTKAEARSRFWWPNIDRDIENKINSCEICVQSKPTPARAPLTPWPFPPHPWYRVHLDFFGPIQSTMFLIMVDAHSKWIECFPLTNNYSSATVISKLEEVMSRFGIMHTIVTDNGTSFTSKQFKDFCQLNGIKHLTSPTYSAASNGQAEICVKIVKKHINGLIRGGTHIREMNGRLLEFLFRYRNCKHTTTNKSPAELMIGRQLRNRFDLLKERNVNESSPLSMELHSDVNNKQCLQAKYYNGNRKIDFKPDDRVLINLINRNKWVRGVVRNKIGKSIYEIYLPQTNELVKKHKNQIHRYKGEDNLRQECEENHYHWSVMPTAAEPPHALEEEEEEWIEADPGLEDDAGLASPTAASAPLSPLAARATPGSPEDPRSPGSPGPPSPSGAQQRRHPRLRNIPRIQYKKN